MNILYLIGNGFDINAGLPTKSTDFYSFLNSRLNDEKYKEHNKQIAVVNKDIKESKWDKSDRWKDYEIGLGNVSEKFDKVDDYKKALFGLSFIFKDYLDQVEDKIKQLNITGDTLSKFNHGISSVLFDGLTNEDYDKVNALYNSKQSNVYKFVSFNYTTLLYQLIDKITTEEFYIKGLSNPSIQQHTRFPLYIHGCKGFDDAPIVGLNDLSQVANVEFRKDKELDKYIVKSTMNKRLRNNKLSEFRSLVNEANIICCFGLSMGKTDKDYWKRLGNWLSNKNYPNRYLIINKPKTDDDSVLVHPLVGGDIIDNEIDNFLNMAEIEDSRLSYVYPKVLIASGSTGFDLF